MTNGWSVVEMDGTAADLHAIEPTGGAREAWWLSVDRPALVLGSSQREGEIDLDACSAAGVEVTHRHSGGGAVLMMPGEMLWLDVVVPVGDPMWADDIGRAMWWLGELWSQALAVALLLPPTALPDIVVHRGPMKQTAWSRLVCFDGLGAGEVTIGGRKAVGISQRRTRDWIKLQSSVHLAWRPQLMVSLLRPPAPLSTDLADPFVVDPAVVSALQAEIARVLATR